MCNFSIPNNSCCFIGVFSFPTQRCSFLILPASVVDFADCRDDASYSYTPRLQEMNTSN